MTRYPFTLALHASEATLDVDMQWAGLTGTSGCNARQCMGRVTGTASKVN